MSHAAQLHHLRRLRWGVLVAVIVGIAASDVMNVLHAPHNPIAPAISAAPPLALFASLELISRIPSSNRWLSVGRVVATLTVAEVGGSISYATVSLVEVVCKIRQLEGTTPAPHAPPAVPTSPDRPPLEVDALEAIAFRHAQAELRKTSRIPAMNGHEDK